MLVIPSAARNLVAPIRAQRRDSSLRSE